MSETLMDVVSLTATAEREVDQDFIAIMFVSTQQSADASLVQARLAQDLSAALAIAKDKKKGNQVRVETGNFQVSPQYDKKGAIGAYIGSVQLIISGTDTKTVSALTGEISTMQVAGVQHGISTALRKKVEAKLATEAIELFREKGATYSAAFGAKGARLVNADVRVGGGYRGGARLQASSAAYRGAVGAAPALESEGGKEVLTATVQGSIQLVR